MSDRFDGRNVLVTGAARGIGRAIVTAFLAEGATVLAADVDEARLAQTAAEIGSPRLHTRACDIADVAAAVDLVGHAIESFGRLHVLVNNAGVMPEGPILEVGEALFERTFAVNVKGPFFATQAAARHMCANGGGAIVSIASANVFQGESPEAPYNASKAAVVTLARSFAHELGHLGLRVNCVAPGETLTPEAVAEMDADDIARERAYARRIPMRRPGRVEEQAAAVLFLASDEASFVNGQTLIVDGGELSGSWWNDNDAPPLPDHVPGLPRPELSRSQSRSRVTKTLRTRSSWCQVHSVPCSIAKASPGPKACSVPSGKRRYTVPSRITHTSSQVCDGMYSVCGLASQMPASSPRPGSNAVAVRVSAGPS